MFQGLRKRAARSDPGWPWLSELPYARHYNPLLIRNRSWILTIHKARILRKKALEKTFLNFKKWVKSIQTAGYNGARTVDNEPIHITLWTVYIGYLQMKIFLFQTSKNFYTSKSKKKIHFIFHMIEKTSSSSLLSNNRIRSVWGSPVTALMPCPSIWPKQFWSVQNGFGLTKLIWTWL